MEAVLPVHTEAVNRI